MLEPIRPATPEEIETIKQIADLTPGSAVVAMSQGEGKPAILAVVRTVTEVDPVIFNDASDQRKAMFLWGVENMLRFQGIQEYYCNVHAADERQQVIMQKMGSEPTSTEPEIRFKKRLL